MASKKQIAWRKKFAAMAKARFKKNKSHSSHNQKDTAVKGRSKKKRRHSSGGGTKHRSRTTGRTAGYSRPRRKSSGGSGKFDVTKILTQVAVSVAMVFGVTYLVNTMLNKFNLSPDKATIAKWALTLGIPGLALFFGKKYPLVQAAAVATIAFAVFNWAKTVLPVNAQTALAGFPQAPYNPLAPSNVSTPGFTGVSLIPQPLN